MLYFIRRRRILQDGVDFKQTDSEWDWDNSLMLHTLMGAIACYFFPTLKSLPIWNSWGLPLALILHVLISEPLFYLFHKIFHSGYFFKNYHSIHHSSPVPQPFTAGFATPLEHIVMGVVMGVPILECLFFGVGSAGLVYVYVLVFDFLRCMAHSNVEVFPSGLFESFPFLRYLIYTPTYHSLHHTEKETNFCLFMPIFDKIGGTVNGKPWKLQKEISSGKFEKVPDFVFLAHMVNIMHSMHGWKKISTKNYCRAISSTSSIKQVKMARAVKDVTEKKQVVDLSIWKLEIERQVANQVNNAINSITSTFMKFMPSLQEKYVASPTTPQTEGASNLGYSHTNNNVLN